MDDFIGSGGYNRRKEDDDTNTKKWMKIIGVFLILLFILVIAIICMMYYIDTTELKITIDGKQVNGIKEILVFDENNKIYIPVRKFAQFVGYESFKGDYKEEYSSQVFVKNANEEAYFNVNSNIIEKKLLNGEDDYEYYEISEPVKMNKNNELYTTIEGAQIAFNIFMSYNNNNITIYTLPYLVAYYNSQNPNTGIADKDASFSNQKALLYDMLIVKNTNNYYGVSTLSGKELLGTKYKNIEFIESTKEFIVTTVENKMGIMSYDENYNAITKIIPEYDNIKQIDKNAGLYLVTNNKKQGVVNQYGSKIVYIEYDQIGIDKQKFDENNVKNTYLLYEKCIPVKLNNKWGIIDTTGKKLSEIKYDDLGCIVTKGIEGENNTNSVLLIYDNQKNIQAIVVKEGEKYGLISSDGKQYLPSVFDVMYSTTSEEETVYKMIYQAVEKRNVIGYLEANVIKKDNNTTNNQNNNTTNTQTNNTQTNNNQTTNNTNATNTETNNTTNNTTDAQTNTTQTTNRESENNTTVETSTNTVQNSQNTQVQNDNIQNSNTTQETNNSIQQNVNT